LTESLLLSLAGGALGVLIASWCTKGALALLPSILPAISQVKINGRVLLFSFALSLVSGVLFGFVPAFKAGAVSLRETLQQGARGILRGRRRSQYVLIVAQVALTLMLLAGAGLMIRSLERLWSVNPGFDPQGVLVFLTGLSPQRSATPEKTREALRALGARLRALPGIDAASVDVGGPPFFGNTTLGFRREDEVQDSRAGLRMANLYGVGPAHFTTMGIPLVRGRSFTDRDMAESPLVTVIDEDSARAIFPGQNPIGKYLHSGLGERPVEIVGIAGRIKQSDLDPDAGALQRAQLYFPLAQLPDFILPMAAHNGVFCIVRSKMEPAALLRSIRTSLASFDSERAIFAGRPMTDAIAGSLAPRRFSMIVLGAFAAMALALALVGIYGVLSYFVSQRTNEIGVRMTLGAQPRDILFDVVRDGATMGITGIAIGLAGAVGLTRLMGSLLFGVSSTDLATFVCAALLLFGLTILASYLPARRALRIHPATALRCS
jgi:putative ABC transport system permease protein